MSHPLRLPPSHLLACPRCGADTDSGLNVDKQECTHCDLMFFDLSGMPCWFNVGQSQLRLWQSLYGLALEQANRNLELSQQEGTPYDLLTSNRERLEMNHRANNQIIHSLRTLMDEAGLQPIIDPEFANYDSARMLQYFELLLRDWAWDSAVSPEDNENSAEFARIQSACQSTGTSLGHTLVLGAGAGRLSWDIQRYLEPESTVALDTNPVLITAAHRLVAEKKKWLLPELQPNPQAGFEAVRNWTLCAPMADPSMHDRWFAMAANAWNPPFRAGVFDTIVTPWFIDVNGKDVRTLIAQVQRLLKAGGTWINTGPLLYGPDIPLARRYTQSEIAELITLAGFEVSYQNIEVSPYLKTPLSAQIREEQVWTFVAKAPVLGMALPESQPPAWIVLPHLPIPIFDTAPPEEPVLQHLLSLVDGRRSINHIAGQIAPNLGADKDPVALVQAVFREYILNQD